MTKKVLAIIPARGGSKGLPRKNIADLVGRPLIAWTIEASLNSKYITKTMVSSDDKEILDISVEYGAETIKRPENLASDDATSESVVKHAIDYLKTMGEVFDIVVLLQPTSPLRNSKDIDEAFEVMFDSSATAVISVCDLDNKILKAFINNTSGFLKGISNDKYPFMRRQDLPKVYIPNGAIYIIEIKLFLEKNSFLTKNSVSYTMSKNKSIDIDTLDDVKISAIFLTSPA
jgi:CMP-N,N'-diacetyllegionaminic acid synthase